MSLQRFIEYVNERSNTSYNPHTLTVAELQAVAAVLAAETRARGLTASLLDSGPSIFSHVAMLAAARKELEKLGILASP